jgi:hypothetical protein
VEQLKKEGKGYWNADVIGVSQKGRPLVRLSNDPGESGDTRKSMFCLARQHSGETPGSWVLDGFLRYCADSNEQDILIWAVPFANIDGVVQGDYGKDPFPHDLNRAWESPAMRYEVQVLQQDLASLAARSRLELGIDFHAPGGNETYGIYHFAPSPKKNPEWAQSSARFSDPIERALKERYAAAEFSRIADYLSRWADPGESHSNFVAWCFEQLGACGMTFETPYAFCGNILMTREEYRKAGALMAKAVLATMKSR